MRLALNPLRQPPDIRIVVAALLGLSTVIKLLYVDHFSYWTDEAYTVWFSRQSLYDLWFSIPKFESHPPAYYTLAKFWQGLFGDSPALWYRHLSILLSLVPLPFLCLAAVRLAAHLNLNRSVAALTVAIFYCFFPAVMWYSIEARPYILFFAAFSAAFYATVRLVLQTGPGDARSWVVFALAGIATNWSHNTGMLFTFVLGLALTLHWVLAMQCDRFFLYRFGSAVVIITLGTSPLLVMIVSQISNWESSTWLAEPTISYLATTLYDLFTVERVERYLFRVFSDNIVTRALATTVALLPVLLALAGMGFLLRGRQFQLAFLFFASVLGVPLLCFVISVAGPNVFLPRIFFPTLAPFFVLVGLTIALMCRGLAVVLVPAGFFILLVGASMHRLHLGFKEPWQQIARHMNGLVTSDSVILLMPNYLSLPLDLYDPERSLNRQSSALPAAFPALGVSDFYPAGTPSVPGMRPQDAELVNASIRGAEKVFLLTRSEETYDPHLITQSEIAKQFRLTGLKAWGGVTLYHFERDQPD